MSLAAMLWTLNSAPVSDPGTLLVLLSLADNAGEDGEGAYPSVATIARKARCSERTVHRHLRWLEEAGLISRGDQDLVSTLRPDRRPVVWNILMRGVTVTPRHPARGVTDDTHGVTSATSRGDTGGRQTVLLPSEETVPSNSARDTSDPRTIRSALAFEEFWALYPKKTDKRAALKAWESEVHKPGIPIPAVNLALDAYLAECQAEKRERKFIKNPATWLRATDFTETPESPRKQVDAEVRQYMEDHGYVWRDGQWHHPPEKEYHA